MIIIIEVRTAYTRAPQDFKNLRALEFSIGK